MYLSIYPSIYLSTCLPIYLSCPVLLFYLILSVLSILSILSYPILPYLTLSYLSYLSHLISSHLISSHLISSHLILSYLILSYLSIDLSFCLSVCLSFYLSKNLPIYTLPLCHSQHETKHAREHLRNAQARFKCLQIIKVIIFSVMTCQFLV